MFSFFKKQSIEIPEVWSQLENWLIKNASHLMEGLNLPASNNNIEQLEKQIDVKLPSEYIEFLKSRNGQNRDSEGLIDTKELLSIERILEEWTV
tara:strand:- start:3321 stop:3602 length:282 start_codon:yes stop_codon:yes gene_type:complete